MEQIKILLINKFGEKQGLNIYNMISEHFANEYMYLVGDFGHGPQAKSAETGQFVQNEIVIKYLQ